MATITTTTTGTQQPRPVRNAQTKQVNILFLGRETIFRIAEDNTLQN